MTDRWLDLAPKPGALPAGRQWHVFLSCRSVNRAWVLALYDVLNVLGYKVFLDQYVLTAAAPLAIALGDALDASAGAIKIWSGSYEDSAWCKQEFAKLETMQNQNKGFRYVIARIDESEIAGFAAAKLWIDFSQQREGPAGTGLLSLLYGLRDQPLPPEAVKLAAEVDAQMKDGLPIEQGVDIRFVQRLLGHSSIATTEIYADSGDCGHGFRLNATMQSDRRRPPVPMKAAGVSLPA